MCNSYAKFRARFVAYSERNSDAAFTSWIEKPNKRGKLPTADLGRNHFPPHIPATEVDSTGRIGYVKNSSWKTEVLLPGSWRGATSTLLSRGHHHIIVDTGMPHEAHRLLEALEKRGLHPSDIRMVINTHFHVDHVLNNCLFPESDIYGSQQSYEWCCHAYADLLDDQNWENLSLQYYPESADYEKAPELMGALRRFALRWWDRKRLGDPRTFAGLKPTRYRTTWNFW